MPAATSVTPYLQGGKERRSAAFPPGLRMALWRKDGPDRGPGRLGPICKESAAIGISTSFAGPFRRAVIAIMTRCNYGILATKANKVRGLRPRREGGLGGRGGRLPPWRGGTISQPIGWKRSGPPSWAGAVNLPRARFCPIPDLAWPGL